MPEGAACPSPDPRDAGLTRYTRVRATIDQITLPLFADIPAENEAPTRRVLTAITERARVELARA